MSTQAALERLGLAPCYHFVTQFERPEDADVWLAAASGQPVDWKALFADFKASVDWPESAFYKQLMDVYPEAKVLLTVRDAEKWYQSVSNTVYPASQMGLSAPADSLLNTSARVIDLIGWQGIFHGCFEDEAETIATFERWNQEVREYVPADRLLVWSVQEGWEPLCRFLGVAVPDEPFPRLNDTAAFQDMIQE